MSRFQNSSNNWVTGALVNTGIALIMLDKNPLELPLGVWTNQVDKTSWASLPTKQAITVAVVLVQILREVATWLE